MYSGIVAIIISTPINQFPQVATALTFFISRSVLKSMLRRNYVFLYFAIARYNLLASALSRNIVTFSDINVSQKILSKFQRDIRDKF